jgi:hypothetical protein
MWSMRRSSAREAIRPAAAALLAALACVAAAACSGRASVQRAATDPSPATAERRDELPTEPPRLHAVTVGGKVGFIDGAGKLVIRPQFDPLTFINGTEFSDGMARISAEKPGPAPSGSCGRYVYGYIDDAGRLAVPPRFDEAEQFSEGLAAVRLSPARADCAHTSEDRYGYIDRTGRVALQADYHTARSFSEGLAGVCGEGWCGYIDRAGRRVISTPPGVFPTGAFSDGLASVNTNDGKIGYIDKTGRVVISPQFYSASDFSEGLAVVSAPGGRKGFIDKTGGTVVEPVYKVAYPFSDGLARVTVGGKNGYIDKTGRAVIEPRYGDAKDFSEGLAPVETGGLWGYIDKAGSIVVKPRFDLADVFVGGVARVVTGRPRGDAPSSDVKTGYIDKTGRYVWQPSK